MYRITLFIVLAALILTGCQPTTSKSEYSTVQVCKDLALFKTSLEKLKNMDATASLTELDAQLSVVRQNLMNLTQSAANMMTVDLTTLNEAITNLVEARDQLPDDASIKEILKSLEEEIAAVSKATDAANTNLKCVN